MNLVKAKCPICGGELDVNAEAECLVCKFCGSPFIVEKAINNYNTSVTNNVTNNIKADNVIIQGKNIESLKKRGLELLNPLKIVENGKEDKKALEIKKIADAIIEQDANNFYGRLFLIDSGDCTQENFDICSKTEAENEQKQFVDYLVDSINWKLKFMENVNQKLLHLQIKEGVSSMVLLGLDALKNMSESCEYAKQKYEQLENKIQSNIIHMIDIASNNFTNFYYSKDSVSYPSYEFQSLCDLASYLNIFINYFIEYVDKEAIRGACKKIFNVVNTNKSIIMQNNAVSGKYLLANCAELSGDTFSENDLNELTKVFVSGLFASIKTMSATLYSDKIVINIEGSASKTILIKDILLLNMNQTLVAATMRTRLWYDLVYKLSDTTYTLLHFSYDMKLTESFFDCNVYKSLSSWCTTNSIRNTDTKYTAENPFVRGYNGLTYIDTQSALEKKGGCYVATCVYGSYDCPQVWILRRYRDYYLDEHWWGRLFIKAYYAISPKIVKVFGKTKWFNKINRTILDRKINKLFKKGYEDTIYTDKY